MRIKSEYEVYVYKITLNHELYDKISFSSGTSIFISINKLFNLFNSYFAANKIKLTLTPLLLDNI